MGIFAQIQSAVDSILPQLYEDDDLTSVVVWKKFTSSDFDEDEGVNVDVYTDYEDIKAIKVEKEIGSNSPGKTYPPGPWSMASGEVQYLFQHDDVPEGASIRDLIVDGSFTYSVKKIFPVFGLIVKVDVEGYA
jgi:hypothetical protein